MRTWDDIMKMTRGNASKHQWELWMNGDPHNLTPYVDFQCSVESFRVQAHRNAKANGHAVRTKMQADGTLTIQAVGL